MNYLEEFLTYYRKLKVSVNYTAVAMHDQSKSVGKKSGNLKRKGSSAKKPEIETYTDPFQHTGISDYVSMPTTQSQTSVSQTTSPQNTSSFESGDTSLFSSQDTSPFFSQDASPFVAQDTSHQNTLPSISQNRQSFFSRSIPPSQALQAVGTQISSPFAYQVNNAFHLPQRIAIPDNQPFEVKFLTGYIKICAGCRNGYARSPNGKVLPAPLDLCLVHKEQHVYYNVINNRQQLSSPSNVHYHVDVSCVRLRYPDFNPQAVQIPPDVRMRLQPAHKVMLYQTFGIS